MLYRTKKLAEKAAIKRRKSFRKLARKEKDPKYKNFLIKSTRTVKVRKLTGYPKVYEVIGR